LTSRVTPENPNRSSIERGDDLMNVRIKSFGNKRNPANVSTARKRLKTSLGRIRKAKARQNSG